MATSVILPILFLIISLSILITGIILIVKRRDRLWMLILGIILILVSLAFILLSSASLWIVYQLNNPPVSSISESGMGFL